MFPRGLWSVTSGSPLFGLKTEDRVKIVWEAFMEHDRQIEGASSFKHSKPIGGEKEDKIEG